MTKKITKRDKYEALLAILNGETTEITTADLMDFCRSEIVLLDNKAAKAKERAEKKKSEGDELAERIFGILTDDFQTLDEIVELFSNEDLSKPKISYRLNQFVKNGTVAKEEVATDAGKRVAFKLV